MSIKVYLHKTHRQFTNGREVVDVKGKTVADCLEHLIKQFPAVKQALFNEKNKLHNVIEVYINEESAYPNELAKLVTDGDEIYLTLTLAGG